MGKKNEILDLQIGTVEIDELSIKDKPIAEGGEGKKAWKLWGSGIKFGEKRRNCSTFSKTEHNRIALLPLHKPVTLMFQLELRADNGKKEWKFRLLTFEEECIYNQKKLINLLEQILKQVFK